ncbi:hypothetical protein [Bradyrhizobium iriomotense]|uniref:Transposase n=1 Tax=Bradyrhizobium iriomotense TaxID=441950 RepID=A0ABQ6BB13_9BRAD|nr:hypothetical protein [Bradyrhizobium iriomotense]GLR91535.1 hypothetical protein GCM10007857_82530 [Bradyrhizobium iriomotense]
MNYSSVAERAIEAVNRLLIFAMTSAWTTTLDHQHALPTSEEDWDADECSDQESSLEADLTKRQH